MKLNIKNLKREGHLHFNEQMGIARVAEEVVDISKTGPVHVEGDASFTDPLILIDGRIRTVVTYICDRCLTTFDKELVTRLVETFTENETDSDGEDIRLLEENELNLDPFIEEAIFLAVDERPICRKDCKGLCPECGKNRNVEACQCDTRPIDPRLAALKDLLSDEESE